MTLNEVSGYIIKVAVAATVIFTGLSAIAKFLEDFFNVKQGIGNRFWSWVSKASRTRREVVSKIDLLTVKMEKVEKEVTYNGGTQLLRDVVKQLREELSENTKMSREMLNREKIKYELNGDMQFMMDTEGNMYQPSKALLKFFGYSEQDVAGRGWQQKIPLSEWPKVTPLLHHALRHHGSRFESVHTMIDNNGEEHNCNMVAIPLMGDDRSLMGFMGLIEVIEN